jgi:hypothetical protein
MVQLGNNDPIEFLVHRKFPHLHRIRIPSTRHPLSQADRTAQADMLKESGEYRNTLRSMPRDELSALLVSEKKKEEEELLARAEAEESQRAFNQPYAAADFAHWSKAAYWTLDEALALSFGKSPEVVNWEAVRLYEKVSPFARKYGRVRDLAQRAKTFQKLYDPVLPIIYVLWAANNDIDFPEALAQQVRARGNWIDWKVVYEETLAVAAKTKPFMNKRCKRGQPQKSSIRRG